ncbi:MAG: hypothetical protein VB141_11085 [Burkholderia gladioli]
MTIEAEKFIDNARNENHPNAAWHIENNLPLPESENGRYFSDVVSWLLREGYITSSGNGQGDSLMFRNVTLTEKSLVVMNQIPSDFLVDSDSRKTIAERLMMAVKEGGKDAIKIVVRELFQAAVRYGLKVAGTS